MQNRSFDQSQAENVIFSAYAVLRESGYSGPVVIDAADTDAYVAAAADCIVQLHCMTGYDANSGLYGKGKKSVYDECGEEPCGAMAALAVRREP